MERCSCVFFFFLILSALSTSFQASARQLNQTKAQLLVKLFANLESSFYVPNNLVNNNNKGNPCSWTGVTCVSRGSSEVVSQLSFSNLNISATVSPFAAGFFDVICSLNTLQYLDISGTFLWSPMDSFFSRCTGLIGLKYLNLSNSLFTGEFPDMSNFRNLEVLDLSYNAFTGTIDTKLASLTQLKVLDLSTSMLTGIIPNDIFKHGKLTLLDLSYNNLNGSVPDEFHKLPKLEILLLFGNHLSGKIPKSLTNLTNLSQLEARENNFYGSIPIGLTKYIKVLDLSYNNLTGDLHADLLSAPTLESVDVSRNALTGSIPLNLSLNLNQVSLGSNQLNGSLPNSLGELSRLSFLYLEGNDLSGNIPHNMGNLMNLMEMELEMNKISGIIPYQISNMVNLITLDLSQNALSGEIPFQIFYLQNLSYLYLQGNNLSGSIPTTISSMTSLIELQLGENKLNGTIPEMPSSLSIALNLSHNCFSGSNIFSSLSKLPELESLDLSYNNFSGPVPGSLTLMYSLTFLDLSSNNLSGTIPILDCQVTVIISGNALLSDSNWKQHCYFNNISNPPHHVNYSSHSDSESVADIDTAFLVAMVVCFASGMVASFSLASIISNCFSKPEVTEAKQDHTDRITSPSVETPSLDRYLEMVQRWEYRARMDGPRQQRRRMSPLYS